MPKKAAKKSRYFDSQVREYIMATRFRGYTKYKAFGDFVNNTVIGFDNLKAASLRLEKTDQFKRLLEELEGMRNQQLATMQPLINTKIETTIVNTLDEINSLLNDMKESGDVRKRVEVVKAAATVLTSLKNNREPKSIDQKEKEIEEPRKPVVIDIGKHVS